MARPEFDLVVIGGGSGGLVVAAGGATLGAKVALVEKDRLGGDCLWTGCVPSKALIKSARVAHEMREAARWGLTGADPEPDIAKVMAHVADVIAAIAPHDSPERFRGLGIDVILEAGKFVGPDAFEVGGRTLTASHFVLATGSRPAVPPLPGLEQVPYLTNENVFDLRQPVPSLAVIGGGPIGCELAQSFRRLGSEVTVIDVAKQLLPKEDPDLVAVVAQRLRDEGVTVLLDAKVGAVEGSAGALRLTAEGAQGTRAVNASHVLVATGRAPNLDHLGLEAAQVKTEKGRLVMDDRLRTTNPRIYAVGDIAGPLQFTHMAEHQAGIVLRQTLFKMFWARPSSVVPWCTFTDPELARVGLSETEAREKNIDHAVHRFSLADNDRAQADGATEGFAKLITGKSGKILGVAIVGSHAGELIAEYALAMQNDLSASALSNTIHPYPTLSQTNRRVADEQRKAGLTPWRRKLLQRVLGLRGS
ncbi:MAG: mercuric reductase [Casimicrobiaceae bacterium]